MASVSPNGSAGKPPTILLVEDEVLLRLFCAEALEEAGFSVIEVRSAGEALRVLEACDDILILFSDIAMAELDGLALARRVRQHWPHIPVVLTSGRVRLDPTELPDQVCFIPKPYHAETIVDTIRALTERVE